MTLYLYEQHRPFENTLFDVFNDDDFFRFNYPLRHYHGHRHGFNRRNPYKSLERQLCKVFDGCKNEENELFKFSDYIPNINLSEDEKNYYIHADLPGMTKDQVKMELNENRILTISGERESIYDNNEEKDEQKEEKQKEEKQKEEKQKEEKQKEEKQKEKQNEKGKKQENTEESTEKMETEENTTTTEDKKKNNENRKYSMIECSYGKFERSFTLPEDANLEGIQAKMENGVLEVIINKVETPKLQNRSIQIQ